jgi:subtilisin family serine protease
VLAILLSLLFKLQKFLSTKQGNKVMVVNNTDNNPEGLVDGQNFVPGEVIVKLKPGTTTAEARSLRSDLDATVIESTETLGIQRWSMEDMSVQEAITTYSDNPEFADVIEYIEPNYIVSAQATPNDPRYSELYGLNNTGQTGGTPDADIDAPEAWDTQTGNDVVIGVIDTGVDYNHPDLNDNMWTNTGETPNNGVDDDGNGFVDDYYGYDFVNEDGDPLDDYFHGTHVAGTIAAEGNNSTGVTGVNWDAQIMGLKFLDSSGFGSTFDAIEAVEYSIMMGVSLTSNSWGGGGFSQALEDAIAAAGEQGQLFVAAAGNDYGNDNDVFPTYPASYDLDNIIAVAATNSNDQLADFSSVGANTVDLGAPGEDVLSLFPGGDYSLLSGTSMATPHVAGVVGLILSENPGLSAEEVKDLILRTVDPLTALEGRTVSGGRLNAANALDELGPPPPPIVGTEEDDVLTGTNRNDTIQGLGGNDLIQGLSGNDNLSGGTGNDVIAAGGGNDLAEGGDGSDFISGDDGDDTLSGNAGRDDIFGGEDNDSVSGGTQSDRLLGEAGDDTLLGEAGNDTVDGGDGNDSLNGGTQNDQLFGSSGNDLLFAEAGNDTLNGGLDNDSLEGGDGNDQLLGVNNSGATPGIGELDTLNGGNGRDVFWLADANGVYYDDGDALTTGESDYALIKDFNQTQDLIQLQGSADLYSLDFFTSTEGSFNAALIYDTGTTARGETIGILENVDADLSVSNPAFTFV